MKQRKEESRGFGLRRRLFSYTLIGSVVCLSLLCLFYGTTFAPSLRRSDSYGPTTGPLSRHVIGQGGGRALLASNLTATSFPVFPLYCLFCVCVLLQIINTLMESCEWKIGNSNEISST